jgi:aminoglycoside phosphotransferase family enzyme/predicted kinase
MTDAPSGIAGKAPALEPAADELRTTHASWVYLRGGDVWKLKRPVDLGFLDFRDVEARRRFCEDEVRLNRRLAPDVYLGVEPMRRGARGLTLDGTGPIVDWAVHMRRLPDQDSASARLWRGQLGAGELEALAARLAAFHAAARETPRAGDAATLDRNVGENFQQTERFVGQLVDRSTFDEVRAFQTAWLAGNADLLRARIAEGRIREGHGDLRLEHVYFTPGADGGAPRPIVIDCVEFSERLRCGDVAADAAFLAMELDAEYRPDLAAGFLARFAEASGDFGMYGLLDFYLSYRAWVRGKVAAFVATDTSVSSEVRAAKGLEARRRFALARSYAGRPVDAPFVVAVSGLPGSGKSTLAAALGRALAVPIVSSDVTRKAMVGMAPEARGGAQLYTNAARERAYDELLRRAGVVLAAGRGVVLDATFATRRWRAAAAGLARRRGAPLVLIDVAADLAVLRARLASRRGGPSISDATDAQLDRIVAGHEPLAPEEGLMVVRVDGEGTRERAVQLTLAELEQRGITAAAARRQS